ncbi:L,D-peptidoglycan transpeptidase YkuD, ErfK/YbiS/YcfS/YnhG family [Jatrophihabitans endophyticus]|uniref:L,D-peptidoglycan transpeptidase YkuD, ErfK/YbiS/YcfS/YnhG family n=1 Tax=Jatrophihabitans endophyticus TaxID=1206085 RepID=A0A1M5C627_9ACTN|nr:L,D-transpeptidase family protein [Jatrophihabitans endophyticus]SHF50218.1 L,D-peptidoglycan transpeptidase YkuD, ErfK/YbiS/YcfS/YnhG family [Jatrophihabitans endophyticus]
MPGRPTRLTVLAALSAVVLAGCSSARGERDASTSAGASTTVPSSTPAPAITTPTTTAPRTSARPSTTARSSAPGTHRPTPPATSTPAPRRSSSHAARTARTQRLPLDLSTGDARQVVTVVASSHGATTATVQRWKRSDGGWRRVGAAIDAYVGSAGVGRASEGSSKTPAGSFTLTQAFGNDGDPGTRLPYFRTTNADYWMSSPGSTYNTHQRCGDCGYDNGVNEHLHEVTPEYDQAVVIDYNTRNAPGGVKAGRGSAFFLHIQNGEPTAGCVAIPRDDLIRVMAWLAPTRHPRILIGVD